MIRSANLVRQVAAFGVLLPFALLGAACSDDAMEDDSDATGGASDSGGRAAGNGGNRSSGGASASGGSANRGGGNGAGATASNDSPAPVPLGAAAKYAILAKSAISNVPTSSVDGDIGLSPAAATYITGFELTKAGSLWTSPEVTGDLYAADNDPPTPTELTTAVSDMETAYTNAAGRSDPTFLNLGAGDVGGLTLTPGLYQWTSTLRIPSDVTLSGSADDVWIFQVASDLEMSAGQDVILKGGAQAKNIVWQVAGTVELGTMSHAEGIILSKTAIALGTGASINGRLFAQTAVHIASSTVSAP